MSREQLLDLASELDRLLTAGAKSATGSDALRRRAKVVEELSTKVAALVPLKDAINKVLTAPAKDSAVALLELLSLARQMRAGLGDAASPGDLGAVTPRQGCQTALASKRAHELHDHFTGGGSGKHAALEEAIKTGEIRDLRLQRVFLDALEDSDGTFAEAVSKEVLPKLGQAVLPELLATLNIPEGESADARRLQSICLIDKKQGAELARKALKEGSVKLIAQALECLPDVVPVSEAEKTGLEFAKDKRATIRAAALQSLRTSKSDACLELMLEKTADKSQEVTGVAYEMLGTMKHPATTNRLMEEVRKQLDNLTVVPKAATKKPAAKGAAKKPVKGKAATPAAKVTTTEIAELQSRRQEELSRCQALLVAMSNRDDLQRKEVAEFLAPLIDHKEGHVEYPVQTLLLKVGPVIPEIMPSLKKLIEKSSGYRLTPIIEMMKGLTVEKRTELMPHLVKATKSGHVYYGMAGSVMELFYNHRDVDPEPFMTYLKKTLTSKEHYLWTTAVTQLLELPSKESAPHAAEALEGYIALTGSYYTPGSGDLVRLLQRDDPGLKMTVPKITKALAETKKLDIKIALLQLLESLGNIAIAAKPAVEACLKQSNKDVKEQAGLTLKALETA